MNIHATLRMIQAPFTLIIVIGLHSILSLTLNNMATPQNNQTTPAIELTVKAEILGKCFGRNFTDRLIAAAFLEDNERDAAAVGDTVANQILARIAAAKRKC
jgi:hypothetical protein